MYNDKLKNERICFFVAETYPSSAGSGLNAFRFAQHLSVNTNTPIHIVCYNYNNRFKKKELINNVIINRIPYYNKNLFFKAISFPYLLINYLKHINRNSLIFIYGRYLVGFETIILFAQLLNRKVIFRSTLLDDDDISSLIRKVPFPLNSIRKYLLQNLSLYWATNQKFSDRWKNNLSRKEKLLELHQGINMRFFNSSNTNNHTIYNNLSIKRNELVILSSGILIERKGYRNIFEQLATLNIPFKYLIAGQTNVDTYHRSSKQERRDMSFLKAYGHKLLGDKLILLGYRKDTLPYHQIADIYIHGANNEASPASIVEAMACKVPIICHNFPGSEFLIQDKKTGLIFNDFDELPDKIISIQEKSINLELITNNAYDIALKKFSFDAITSKLATILYD